MILVIPPILRTGPDEFRNSVRLLRNAFTDLHFEEKEIITTDDKVVARSIVASIIRSYLSNLSPQFLQLPLNCNQLNAV